MSKTSPIQSKKTASKKRAVTSSGSKPRALKKQDVVAAAKLLTKKARLISMLKVKGGATIAEISSELGWQHHTTRAALTGLRKAGFEITSVKSEDSSAGRYSLTSNPAAAK